MRPAAARPARSGDRSVQLAAIFLLPLFRIAAASERVIACLRLRRAGTVEPL